MTADWAQLWFTTLRHDWSSLAIVPALEGTATLPVAEALAAVGRRHGERPVRLVDALGTPLEGARSVIEVVSQAVDQGELVLVALASPLASPAAIAIARAASAALLVVPLGEATFGPTRRAVELVGSDRFLGSVAFEADVSAP